MTRAGRSAHPWSGETSVIRCDLLERHGSDVGSPICYVAGPQAMTSMMKERLRGKGVPASPMRSEEFYGY